MSQTDCFLWWLGWRPRAALVLGTCFGVAFALVFSSVYGALFGGCLLIALWVWGTQIINQNWSKLVEEAESTCLAAGAQKLGLKASEGARYLLRGESLERSALVSASPEYKLAALYVTESFIGIYAGNVYETRVRRPKFGSSTKELYFRHIASVEYNGAQFQLRTASGELLAYDAADSPEVGEAALNAVRQKLRVVQATA